MPNKVPYEFAVIRVVPKVEREEFINVGVIVFSKRKKYLDIKYQLNENRLRAFSEELDVEMLKGYLKAWEAVCRGGAQGGSIGQQELPYRFRWLSASRSTILQTSRIHPGICDSPEEVLEDLFQRYVL
ncbi:DUF3037 domain-containing protein [Lewinella cohaerens]|uniref:DUF3037 domain-containing protein n=1 Tax=Lewinella cohaerens TaxID=70995 RepID=UPI00035FD780|nr:DUF3037 domain-containing protein [Lewinella cohaerens]